MAKVLSEDERERLNKVFGKFKETEYLPGDYEKIFENENKLYRMFSSNTLRLYEEYINYFILLIKDYYNKRYSGISNESVSVITGTLLYVLSPVDIIPDIVPVVGLSDDAAIVALCVASVAFDVEQYRIWKNNE